ncbi:phage tail protein [Staphylococcus equorum]|uniref:major tail protein n=1 Tax=Staphylococcus equorum TaxID=246432 RepID=UPI0024087D67|nr:major tail protein [Staphylococcus equorum]MDG0821333.1 phage tail protein [Staphylococcus equorum]
MMAKKYNSFTGLTGFHYQVHGEEAQKVERIEYLQEVSVSKEQSIEKAYGDNSVAEMAVSNGTIELESTFHHLPLEDRVALFGLTKTEDGLVYVGDNTPPYVSVIFEKTMESGAVEYVGLPKGLFTFPEVEGQTKEDGVEFSQDASTGEFMPTDIEGVEGKQAMILGRDEKGETAMRDAIWEKLFGKAHPDAETETP